MRYKWQHEATWANYYLVGNYYNYYRFFRPIESKSDSGTIHLDFKKAPTQPI